MNVSEEMQTVKSFIQSEIFNHTLRRKLLIHKSMEIILLGQLEECESKDTYKANGYISISDKIFPLEVVYVLGTRRLVVSIGYAKAVISLEEIREEAQD